MRKLKTTKGPFAHITIGIQLALTILLFVYIGYKLDIHYDKSPLFLSIGTLFGLVIGFYMLLKELLTKDKNDKNSNNNSDDNNKIKWM